MAKKRKRRTKKTNKKKEEQSLSVLIAILGIFTAAWFGVLKLIFNLAIKKSQISTLEYTPFILILVLVTFFIFKYILLVIKAIYYHTFFEGNKEIKLVELEKTKRKSYQEAISSWVLTAFLCLGSLFVVIFSSQIGRLWGSILAIVILIIYYLVLHFKSIDPIMKERFKLKNRKLGEEFCKKIFSGDTCGSIFTNVLGILVYLILIIAITSNVDISLDKDAYWEDEDVRVEIRPIGIVVPKIEYVLYSNEGIVIYNSTDKPFVLSKRYLVINSSILKTDAFNSHIDVIYKYFTTDDNFFNLFGNIVHKNVPVYKKAGHKEEIYDILTDKERGIEQIDNQTQLPSKNESRNSKRN